MENQSAEKYIKGDDHRVLVINYSKVYVAKRIAANVIGDGKSTIEQLVYKKNKLRQKIDGLEYSE